MYSTCFELPPSENSIAVNNNNNNNNNNDNSNNNNNNNPRVLQVKIKKK